MLNMMIKNICENSNRIDTVEKAVKKSGNRFAFQILLLCAGLFAVTKTIKNHETEINELKANLENMKTHMMNEDIKIAEVKMELTKDMS